MVSLQDAKIIIRQEEALIRAYRAELALVQLQQQARADDGDGDHNDIDNYDNDTVSPMTTATDFLLEEAEESAMMIPNATRDYCRHLTQSIQGFVFTSADIRNNSKNNQTASSSAMMMIHLQGHFVSDPSVSASIQMMVQLHDSVGNEGSQQQKGKRRRRRRSSSNNMNHSRVVHLQCKLSSSLSTTTATTNSNNNNTRTQNDLSYIETMSKAHCDEQNSLPEWIHTVSSYLEFETRRDHVLSRWEQTYWNTKDNMEEEEDDDNGKQHCPFSWTKQTHNHHQRDGCGRPVSIWIHPPQQPKQSSSSSSFKKQKHQPPPTKHQLHAAADSSSMMSIQWDWNWEEGRDTLHLAMMAEDPNRNNKNHHGLNPKGLQDLVATCSGSCEKALDRILETLVSQK